MLGAGISGLFGGGSSEAPAPAEAAPPPPQTQATQNAWGDQPGISCEGDAKAFTKCLDEHSGNMQICNWYLEQLVRDFFAHVGIMIGWMGFDDS